VFPLLRNSRCDAVEDQMSDIATLAWQPMAKAPKDGTRILVTIRPTEQGPSQAAAWRRPLGPRQRFHALDQFFSQGRPSWISGGNHREGFPERKINSAQKPNGFKCPLGPKEISQMKSRARGGSLLASLIQGAGAVTIELTCIRWPG
jgi:hypothetical protein